MANNNPMTWENIISHRRTGSTSIQEEQRTDFQRDYDRLIFSSAFRRLQNKTQVFPLPGSTFVHNRLTHSLEVASVGRSLGKMAGTVIAKTEMLNEATRNFYIHDLANVIAAACLAHDIGNPAFGHSGEDAISDYFRESENILKQHFSEMEWSELCDFEGNANAFRILTHHYEGKSSGGYRLTYSTLAAIQKYPCQQAARNKSNKHSKKYGFFISESETMKKLAKEVNMQQDKEHPAAWFRHPFVYLTEAADDICYRIIDLEDAQRLGIVDYPSVEEMLLDLLESFGDSQDFEMTTIILQSIGDNNEKTSYLRAKVINYLIKACVAIFTENKEAILNCTWKSTLMDEVEKKHQALQDIEKLSIEKIYSHDTVVQIELAGYHVMSKLLDLFVPAVLTPKHQRSEKQKKTLRMLPQQFKPLGNSAYEDVRLVLDYISGMTDLYATEFYQHAFGFEVPVHR
jgi:dGTPase